LLTVANTVVDGIGDVVNGKPTKLAGAVNTALQGLVAPMIDFGAKQLGLGGLPQTVGNLVQAPRKAVQAAIDRVIGALIDKAKSVVGLKPAQNLEGLVGKAYDFKTGTDSHQLWVANVNGQMVIYQASIKQQVQDELRRWRVLAKSNPGLLAAVDKAQKIYSDPNGIGALFRQINKLNKAGNTVEAQKLQTQMYGQLEKLGDALNVVLEAFKGLNLLIVGEYGKIAGTVPGHQAHHMNQDAAFESVIPNEKGLAIVLWGNILTDKGSPHYLAHQELETFWNKYRKLEISPNNGQYQVALVKSLIAAGFSPTEANDAAAQAAAQRIAYGLTDDKNVPNVPQRIREVELLENNLDL